MPKSHIPHPDTPLYAHAAQIPTAGERMNLTLNMIAILRLMMPAWSSSCYAYDFYAINRQGDTIYYNFGQNNTVEVTYCNTYYADIDTGIYYHGEIVIPDTVEYQGKKYAVELGKNAFSYCKQLTKVVLPAHVTIIPQYCFGGCENLTEVSGFQRLVRIENGGGSETAKNWPSIPFRANCSGWAMVRFRAAQACTSTISLKVCHL